jgi:predicted chitinase
MNLTKLVPLLSPESKQNLELLYQSMKKANITNKFVQAGILAVTAKESGFQLKTESDYRDVDDISKIRTIYKSLSSFTDTEIRDLKNNPEEWFDFLYGGKNGNSTEQRYFKSINQSLPKSEGFKYRGRGFNNLTFKGNYKDLLSFAEGNDIVKNPDLMNDGKVAAPVLMGFYNKSFKQNPKVLASWNMKDINSAKNLADAVGVIFHVTMGVSYTKEKVIDIGIKAGTWDRVNVYVREFYDWILKKENLTPDPNAFKESEVIRNNRNSQQSFTSQGGLSNQLSFPQIFGTGNQNQSSSLASQFGGVGSNIPNIPQLTGNTQSVANNPLTQVGANPLTGTVSIIGTSQSIPITEGTNIVVNQQAQGSGTFSNNVNVQGSGSQSGTVSNPAIQESQGRGESGVNEGQKSNSSASKNIITILQPKLKAREIRFNLPPQKDQQQEIALNFGKVPIIWYGAYQIKQSDVDFISLSTIDGIPTLKVTFKDTYNMMKDKAFPLDDTKISIFINTLSENLKPIHMDFKIVKFNIDGKIYDITGVIDVNQLYTKKFRSIPKKTSFNALKTIAEEVGLGFNSNIDNTDDEMTWINTGDKLHKFIQKIVDKSYKSDEAFLISYLDYFYGLNYIEIEKELNRDIKADLGIPNIGIAEILKIKDKDLVSRLFLTNDRSMETSNSYFSTYTILNMSTSIAIEEGYLTKVKFYDQLKKDFLIFDIDSITSKGDSTIILKGNPQDENFYKENANLVYKGKLDVDNMHKNYIYSTIQNDRNIIDLQKIGMEIVMGHANYNLIKFQKVHIILSNQHSTPSASHINNRLSGEWLIVDIYYMFDGKGFSQRIKLVKRELDLSPEEQQKEGTSPGTQATQNQGNRTENQNPTTTTDGQSTTVSSQSITPTPQPTPQTPVTNNGLDNLMMGESPDPRFVIGLSTNGLKNLFVYQGQVNNCDATSRLLVYKYLDKRGKGKFLDTSLKTVPSLILYAVDLNPKVEMGGYEIDLLFGGPLSYVSVTREANNSGTFTKSSDSEKAMSYMDANLRNGIPIIIGVGIPKFSSGNPDQSSDHFMVVVGKGKAGEYYFHDVGGASGVILNTLKPVQGKEWLYKSFLKWTDTVGEKTGNVYLTFVGIYPKDKSNFNRIIA